MRIETARSADLIPDELIAEAHPAQQRDRTDVVIANDTAVGDRANSDPSAGEFHRSRAEIEMERALKAGKLSVAMRHLELARLHRQRRSEIGRAKGARPPSQRCIDRTDKEG